MLVAGPWGRGRAAWGATRRVAPAGTIASWVCRPRVPNRALLSTTAAWRWTPSGRPASVPEATTNLDLGLGSGLGSGLAELRARGLVQDVSSRAVDPHMAQAARTIYVGVDPTAASLHVGHLIPILSLAHLARAGHRAIIVVGGATGSIGDPSGRSSERNQLDTSTLTRNSHALKAQLHQLLQNIQARSDALFGPCPLQMEITDNSEWTSGVTLLEFLRDVGKYTRMSDMLAREAVASRLNRTTEAGGQASGMSFTEFTYQLLQAYDFYHLHSSLGCTIQLGGSDQMGNIMAGVELILRKRSALTAADSAAAAAASPAGQASSVDKPKSEATDPAYGITLPLLLTSSGQKIGKSAGNALWLTPSLLSHVDFYQYFYRLGDVDTGKALRALTLLPEAAIRAAEQDHLGQGKVKAAQRGLQRLLADEATRLVRGDGAVHDALLAERLLGGEAWRSASVGEIQAVLAPAQQDPFAASNSEAAKRASKLVVLDESTFASWSLVDLVVEVGNAKSKAEAKTLIKNGGVYLNGERQTDARRALTAADAVGQAPAIHLRIGKHDPRIILLKP